MITTRNPISASPRAESRRGRRAARWLLPAALLALTPKCLLCLAAYVGLGAVLGFGGPEICGAPAGSTGSWVSSLAWLGVGALVATLVFARFPKRGTRPTVLS